MGPTGAKPAPKATLPVESPAQISCASPLVSPIHTVPSPFALGLLPQHSGIEWQF
jgi:hypothetical protein